MASDDRVSRRVFIESAAVAAGVATVVGSAAAGALSSSQSQSPRNSGPSAEATAAATQPTQRDERGVSAEGLAYLGPVTVGTQLRGSVVTEVTELSGHTLAVLCRDEAGQNFQIDLSRREESNNAIATTPLVALTLSNGTRGSAATEEAHGLVVMHLAAILREREAAGAVPPARMSTLAQREQRFPRAVLKRA